jgi:Fe-S cluster biogenesis protein NfuA
MPANEFQKRVAKIEELARKMELIADPEIRAGALELVQSVMELHGSALDRILEIAAEAGPPGAGIIRSYAADDLVSSLLLLHDLHPDDLETRVVSALDRVRPYLKSHGGNLELLGIEEGKVRIRLQGSCKGCPGSAVTSKTAIETAIYEKAPDVVAIEVEGILDADRTPAKQDGLVQLT